MKPEHREKIVDSKLVEDMTYLLMEETQKEDYKDEQLEEMRTQIEEAEKLIFHSPEKRAALPRRLGLLVSRILEYQASVVDLMDENIRQKKAIQGFQKGLRRAKKRELRLKGTINQMKQPEGANLE